MHVLGPVAVGLAQLSLALLWTAYAVMLPGLVEAAGMGPGALPWVILLDQLVFAAVDPLLGLGARHVGRLWLGLGPVLVVASLLAAALLVALPWAGVNGLVFVPLVLAWSALTSVLRVPPMVLLRQHLPPSAFPGAAGLSLVGFGVAGALSPYLAGVLAGVAPTLPFALASGAVVVAAAALWGAEWVGRRAKLPDPLAGEAMGGPQLAVWGGLLLATLLLSAGAQVHLFLRMAPHWLAVGMADHMALVVPIFWVGFGLAVAPMGWLAGRSGPWAAGVLVGGAGALVLTLGCGAVGVHAAASVPAVAVWAYGAAQLGAGVAWGACFSGGLAMAVQLAPGGRVALSLGAWFAMGSAAAVLRVGLAIGLKSAGLSAQAGPWLDGLAVVTVLLGAVVVAIVVAAHRRVSTGATG